MDSAAAVLIYICAREGRNLKIYEITRVRARKLPRLQSRFYIDTRGAKSFCLYICMYVYVRNRLGISCATRGYNAEAFILVGNFFPSTALIRISGLCGDKKEFFVRGKKFCYAVRKRQREREGDDVCKPFCEIHINYYYPSGVELLFFFLSKRRRGFPRS